MIITRDSKLKYSVVFCTWFFRLMFTLVPNKIHKKEGKKQGREKRGMLY